MAEQYGARSFRNMSGQPSPPTLPSPLDNGTRPSRPRLTWAIQEKEIRRLAQFARTQVLVEKRRATWYGRASTLHGFLATTFAATAAVTVVPAAVSPWMTAVPAALAALVSGLAITFKPAEGAHRAQLERIRWLGLQDEANAFARRLESNESRVTVTFVEHRLAELQKRRNAVLREEAVSYSRCSCRDCLPEESERSGAALSG